MNKQTPISVEVKTLKNQIHIATTDKDALTVYAISIPIHLAEPFFHRCAQARGTWLITRNDQNSQGGIPFGWHWLDEAEFQPNRGEKCLTWDDQYREPTIAYWFGPGQFEEHRDGKVRRVQATRWMPLPSHP